MDAPKTDMGKKSIVIGQASQPMASVTMLSGVYRPAEFIARGDVTQFLMELPSRRWFIQSVDEDEHPVEVAPT
jgi:hypothetical protein